MKRVVKRLTAFRDWWWQPKLTADAQHTKEIVSAIHALTHVLDHTNYSLSGWHSDESWMRVLHSHAPRA